MKREKGRRKGEKRSPLHPFLLLFKSPTLRSYRKTYYIT
jgi:hypothetical protein